VVTAIVAAVTLIVYALIDCARTTPADIRRLTRRTWLSLILAVPVVGALSWLLLGRPRHHGHRPVAPRPNAPDDDEEFLRALDGDDAAYRRRLEDWERDLRRRERELRGDPAPDDTPDDPDEPDDDDGQPVGRV
jgi:hypothetical protein